MKHLVRLRESGIDSDELVWKILDQSPDCIKVLSCSGELEYMNPNGRAAMEIDDFDDVAGLALPDLWPTESRPRLATALALAASGQKDKFEAYCPTAKGADRWWQVSVSPICNRYGRCTHILCSSRDISVSQPEHERDAGHDAGSATELAHRTRNQLSAINALARISLGSDGASDRERLMERIGKVSASIDVLAQHGRAAPVGAVIEKVLDQAIGLPRFALANGADASVLGETARILAIVLGELESNALTHGALSGAGGAVELTIEGAREGHIHFSWTESLDKAPGIEPDAATGRRLIDRLSAMLPEPAQHVWSESGLRVTFAVEAA
ncbi:PAS domain-containing protein [Croceicoccus bisphenolivorans]|uniref:PAS domain-containing protein n=1 Tax=Croceicoccus bisphenolivorans TaxID=1783232 RepID=UPI00082A721E|nr:PAS domain-containing protein [Croceicoccus bisphenolivorans]